jgi:prepilin-type N-terminal cleavage/methylation domain-containing protein
MKKDINKESGFTLIEVVLVLAIGALIILMALLAFNGASRSRRDTARANAAGTLSAALEQAAANANGVYPPDQTELNKITTTAMNDPKTQSRPTFRDSAAASTVITYSPGASCGTDGKTFTPGTAAGTYAITYRQESSQTVVVCKSNTQ